MEYLSTMRLKSETPKLPIRNFWLIFFKTVKNSGVFRQRKASFTLQDSYLEIIWIKIASKLCIKARRWIWYPLY